MKPGPAPYTDWIADIRKCPGCKRIQLLTNFFVCRSRQNGHVSKCKDCYKLIVRSPVRKSMVIAHAGRPQSLRARIVWAVNKGYVTREAIQRATDIPWDTLMDFVATMTFDDGELKLDRVSRRFRAA